MGEVCGGESKGERFRGRQSIWRRYMKGGQTIWGRYVEGIHGEVYEGKLYGGGM